MFEQQHDSLVFSVEISLPMLDGPIDVSFHESKIRQSNPNYPLTAEARDSASEP